MRLHDWGLAGDARLYPILVSPMFYAIHHAPDIARQSSNYAKMLGIWDRLGERPTRYDSADTDTPISFLGTVAVPFVSLWRRRPQISGGSG